MNCLICLEDAGGKHYHPACLKKLFGSAKVDLSLSASRKDLVKSIPKKTEGFSISGVQMKAQLTINNGKLELVDRDGEFILKPTPEQYDFVAENEHLSLRLMQLVGFDVPPCGLLELNDGHRVFVIRRYDRAPGSKVKYHQEDAMQALGIGHGESESKYLSASYLDVLKLARKVGGLIVTAGLFDRLVFSYLIGNDDHHLKNISFIHEKPFRLAPAYDVLASSMYNSGGSVMAMKFFMDREPKYFREMGNGFYSGGDFVELAEAAGMPGEAAKRRVMNLLDRVNDMAPSLIEQSYLPTEMKMQYQAIIQERERFLRVF